MNYRSTSIFNSGKRLELEDGNSSCQEFPCQHHNPVLAKKGVLLWVSSKDVGNSQHPGQALTAQGIHRSSCKRPFSPLWALEDCRVWHGAWVHMKLEYLHLEQEGNTTPWNVCILVTHTSCEGKVGKDVCGFLGLKLFGISYRRMFTNLLFYCNMSSLSVVFFLLLLI